MYDKPNLYSSGIKPVINCVHTAESLFFVHIGNKFSIFFIYFDIQKKRAPFLFSPYLKTDIRMLLKSFSSKKEILIKKSVKGNSAVVLNRHDYITHLFDTRKFRKIDIESGKETSYFLQLF